MSAAVLIKDGTSTAVFIGTPDAQTAAAQAAAASTSATNAKTSETNAANSAASVSKIATALAIKGPMPYGWFDPTSYSDGAWYRNDYSVKFWSDGQRLYTMMPLSGSGVLQSWWDATKLIVPYTDNNGTPYVAVSLDNVYDPCLQGVAYTTIHVSDAGNDTTGDGSSGAPYRTLDKAITVMNGLAAGTYEILVHCTGNFIGNDTWALKTYAVAQKCRIRANDPTKWLIPTTRSSYTAALFNWQSLGSGVYQCLASNANISAGAKNSPVIYDLSVTDGNGKPIACQWVQGPFADATSAKNALLAVNGPAYTYDTTNGLVLILASGGSPVPGVNFGYCELTSGHQFGCQEGGRLLLDGFKMLRAQGDNISGDNWSFRPSTFTIGSTAPNVDHDTQYVGRNLVSLGSSGNGFHCDSPHRCIWVGCTSYDDWLDGFNIHSLYTYPANSNSTVVGSLDHTFIDRCKTFHHGPGDGRRSANLTVNTSSNTFTSHDRERVTIINSLGVQSHGSALAIVLGSHVLSAFNLHANPKYVTPAVEIYPAAAMSDSMGSDGVEAAAIFSYADTYYSGGQGCNFYAGEQGTLAVVNPLGGAITKVMPRYVSVNTVPADGDTITIAGTIVYTWKTTPAGAFQVQIGASNTASAANLVSAINANASLNTDPRAYLAQAGSNSVYIYHQLSAGQTPSLAVTGTHVTLGTNNGNITNGSGAAL